MNKKKTLGLYFGSFDPLHIGHIHIKNKALEILDKCLLIKIRNHTKSTSIFKVSDLIDIQFSGNLIDIIKRFENQYNVVIVRGLRNEIDFNYETSLFDDLKRVKPDVKIIYIIADEEYRNISSSEIKGLGLENSKQYLI